jgi:hypothetical protein
MQRLNETEEQQAQHIACGHLVKGCEDALSELEPAPGETNRRARTRTRAQEIVAGVLSSWRDAWSAVAPSQGPPWSGDNLDDWTTDELFSEALTRRAGDGPALRLMQSKTLDAQLTAHDDE